MNGFKVELKDTKATVSAATLTDECIRGILLKVIKITSMQ